MATAYRKLSLIDYGGDPTGVANSVSALQAAFNAGSDARISRMLVIPPGTFRLDSSTPILIPAGMTIVGAGASTVLTSSTANPGGAAAKEALLHVTDADDVTLSNFDILVTGGVRRGAIGVLGDSDNVVLERISARDAFSFYIAGDAYNDRLGTVTLRSCHYYHDTTATSTTSQYGFEIRYADRVTLEECHAEGAWLDGLKLGRDTRNVIVRGGCFQDNGVSGNGAGCDAFAGGNQFTFIGTRFLRNTDGLGIKVGDTTGDPSDPSKFGYIKNCQVIGIIADGNTGCGLNINSSTPGSAALTIVAGVNVVGGVFANNGISSGEPGIRVRGRYVSLNDVLIRGTGGHGIDCSTYSYDVSVRGARILAAGQTSAGFSGLMIQGARTVFRDIMVSGSDDDDIGDDTGYSGLTAYTRNGIRIASTASDIRGEVVDAYIRNLDGAGQNLRVDMTSGNCVINRINAGAPSTAALGCGSVGSTLQRTDGGAGTSFYVKEAGNPNVTGTWAGK